MRKHIRPSRQSKKIVALRGKQARLSRGSWDAMSRAEFHGLVARIIGAERQSAPGSARRHWQKKRLEALSYYRKKFGPVPGVLLESRLISSRRLYRTAEYQSWSRAAYDRPAPNPALNTDAVRPQRAG
jgi:hypothetical protein